MADPRSSFRFRMPRLRPSVSSPRSTARKPPFQPEAPAAPTPPSSTVVAPAQPVLPSPPSSTAVAPIQPALPPPTQPALPPPAQPAPAPTPTPVLPAPSSTVVAPAQPVLPPPPPASTSPAPLVKPPPPVSTPAAPAPGTPVVPPASTTNAHAPPVLLPPPPPQDEPRSMPPPLPQAPPPSPVASSFTKPATPKSPEPTKTESSQPFSPSQTGIRSRVSSKPPSPSRMSTKAHVSSNPPPPSPSPSTTSQLTSQPSSPAVTTTKLQPKEHVPDIASHNDQKNVDLALNEVQEGEIQTTTETNEETFIEQPTTEAPKVKQKHQDAINTPINIPNTPETKSIIPQPMDAESLQNPKPINKPEASTDVNKRDTSPRKHFFNEKPLSVITLAGDNRGTSMNINGAIKRESAIHIHRRYKVNPDEIKDTMTDGEEISDGKKSEKDSDDRENAYINCNIQGINNSMVFNSSFAERNPGVHLGRLEDVNKAKWKKSKVMETDTNLPSEKITTIRRRCLRGLFMESSDSDADDPDPHKPRRHGCRYTGGEKMEVV